jgi:hypothetical protein
MMIINFLNACETADERTALEPRHLARSFLFRGRSGLRGGEQDLTRPVDLLLQ